MIPKQFRSHPVKNSKGGRKCKYCGNGRGLIRKYALNICRRCFREKAPLLGFQKTH